MVANCLCPESTEAEQTESQQSTSSQKETQASSTQRDISSMSVDNQQEEPEVLHHASSRLQYLDIFSKNIFRKI